MRIAIVLALSLRATSIPVAREILNAWFSTPTDTGEAQSEWTVRLISSIRQLEAKYGGQTR